MCAPDCTNMPYLSGHKWGYMCINVPHMKLLASNMLPGALYTYDDDTDKDDNEDDDDNTVSLHLAYWTESAKRSTLSVLKEYN